ncbi:hypothetical protein EST38_g3205 [Candolleomyces aberdarensis]|uniref:Uncharacterized protein n=1 Tax=Candolleomyces aberdarensis TaxID=2316362 RepID=A0A4Q2DRJ6_9AGAR|nr:hypothetical protein EST38_g3205 [Candolleomyces aberdarensis]
MLLIVIKAQVEFPLLEEVIVRCKDGRSARDGSIATANIWRGAALRRVVWESVNDDLLWLPVDWSLMEEINVSGNEGDLSPSSFSHRDARCLVRATPVLKRLRIQLTADPEGRAPRRLDAIPDEPVGPENADLLASNPILLPYLTTLDLADAFLDPDIAPTFIEHVQLPALTTLRYRLAKDSTNVPYSSGHPLLWFLRSQQQRPIQVQNWTVDAASMSREVFIDCLRLMPLLKRLWVKDGRDIATQTVSWDEYDEEFEREEEIEVWNEGVVETEVAPDDTVLEALQPSLPDEGTSSVTAGPNPQLEYVRFDRARFHLQALQDFVKLRIRLSTQDHGSGNPPNSLRCSLQRIHVGLMYLRPESDAEELENECLARGIKATLIFARRREGRGYASHLGLTNLADEGVRIDDDEL